MGHLMDTNNRNCLSMNVPNRKILPKTGRCWTRFIQSVALKVDVNNAAGREQAKMAHTILHGDGISVRVSSTEHDIAPGIIGDASKMELDNAAGHEQVHVAHAISHGDGVSVQSSSS